MELCLRIVADSYGRHTAESKADLQYHSIPLELRTPLRCDTFRRSMSEHRVSALLLSEARWG